MFWTQGEWGGMWEKRLTSTVNSFVVAVIAISGPVAEFVEVDALFCPDALYVVEGTSDHILMCACRRRRKKKKRFRDAGFNNWYSVIKEQSYFVCFGFFFLSLWLSSVCSDSSEARGQPVGAEFAVVLITRSFPAGKQSHTVSAATRRPHPSGVGRSLHLRFIIYNAVF